jgi:hypothetical protein
VFSKIEEKEKAVMTINAPVDGIEWKQYKIGQARVTGHGNVRLLLDDDAGTEIGFVQIDDIVKLPGGDSPVKEKGTNGRIENNRRTKKDLAEVHEGRL